LIAVVIILCITFVFASEKADAKSFNDTQSHSQRSNIYLITELETSQSVKFMTGTSDNTFSPDANISRADFCVVLARIRDINPNDYQNTSIPFVDVASSAYYRPYVAWAYKNGLVSGTDSTHFSPLDTLQRQQCARILYIYNTIFASGIPQNKTQVTYADESSMASWAKDAIYCMQRAHVMTGTSSTTFSPEGNVTRSQASTMLVKFYAIAEYFCSGTTQTPVPAATQSSINAGNAEYNAMPMSEKIVLADTLMYYYNGAKAGAAIAKEKYPVASEWLSYYLSNTGTNRTAFPVSSMLTAGMDTSNYEPQARHFELVYGDLVRVAAECYSISGKTVNFTMRKEGGFDAKQSGCHNNWKLSLGYYRYWGTASVTQSSETTYTLSQSYSIRDYYDWDKNADYDFSSLVNSVFSVAVPELWRLNYAGMARNFNTSGSYSGAFTTTGLDYNNFGSRFYYKWENNGFPL